jgi:predicted DNA-binding transcriptional regulator YafY
MSRAQRLLELLQILRNHRFPVTGEQLASKLGISLRTLYRDIDALREQGAHIDGESGVGYVLRPGFLLPPLMFSDDEIEAMVLGSRWVKYRGGDTGLSAASFNAMQKIAAVLPDRLRHTMDDATLLIGDSRFLSDAPDMASDKLQEDIALNDDVDESDLSAIRRAIRSELKIRVSYLNEAGEEVTSVVWPFMIGYFEHVRLLGVWSEQQQRFCFLSLSRITAIAILTERYPRYRQSLLKEFRQRGGLKKLATMQC